MDYKGLRDRHLNVFCGYAKDYYENNITKALINVLDSLPVANKVAFIRDTIGIDLPTEDIDFEFYLQRQPSESIILSVPEERKYLFAFSPTGKSYPAPEGLDSNDKVAVARFLEAELRKNNPDIEKDELLAEVEKRTKDYLDIHDKGSIPDGWVIVNISGNPTYIIGMENKLYDLNPYQLKNHLENGMHCSESHQPVYATFEKIVNVLDKSGAYLAFQFHEYLMILGYLHVDSIIDVATADPKIRRELGIETVSRNLKRLFPGLTVNKRKWYVPRVNGYGGWLLKEINVELLDSGVQIPLAFGTTMAAARELFYRIEAPFNIKSCPHCIGLYPTFHFQDQWGRNVRKSYVCNNDVPYERYFAFWKVQSREGRRLKPKIGEVQDLLRKMRDGECLSETSFNEMMEHFSSHGIPVTAVPESMIYLFWPWDEISSMPSNEYFFEQLMNEVNIVIDYLHIEKDIKR